MQKHNSQQIVEQSPHFDINGKCECLKNYVKTVVKNDTLKTDPRPPQDRPKIAPDQPKTGQDRPKTDQNGAQNRSWESLRC